MASVYPGYIRESVSSISLPLPVNWGLAFWLLALLAFLLAAIHGWGNSHVRRREVDSLVARSDELARTIRTLPPEAFLHRFGGVCAQAIEAFRLAVENPDDLETVSESARWVLRSIAILAKAFDRSNHDAIYAANLFVHCPCDGPSKLQESWPDVEYIYPAGFCQYR